MPKGAGQVEQRLVPHTHATAGWSPPIFWTPTLRASQLLGPWPRPSLVPISLGVVSISQFPQSLIGRLVALLLLLFCPLALALGLSALQLQEPGCPLGSLCTSPRSVVAPRPKGQGPPARSLT